MLPKTEQAKQQEWNTILSTARDNSFPLWIIHNLKNKLMLKTQQTKVTHTHTHTYTQTQQKKKWVTFTYHRPLIHKVINLF